jgi:hypothetical protein
MILLTWKTTNEVITTGECFHIAHNSMKNSCNSPFTLHLLIILATTMTQKSENGIDYDIV